MAYGDWTFTPHVYDRFGTYVGTPRVLAASWTKTTGGEDDLTMATAENIDKGSRVVWRDWRGAWHENVADEQWEERMSGEPVLKTVCRTPLRDLEAFHVEDKRPRNMRGPEALAQLLSGTTWTAGAATAAAASTTWYRCSALEALRDFAEKWGAELSYEVTVGPGGVTGRSVVATERLGTDSGRRFDYGFDLKGVKRTVDTGTVRTALYGYGRGEAVGDGYGRRLTFDTVNPTGLMWVGDEEARLQWGVPDGSGGMLHSFGRVEFDDCEDPEELLRLTTAELENVKAPAVTYTLDAAAFGGSGFCADDLGVGDAVEFVDTAFTPTLRGTARVTSMTVDLASRRTTSLVLGNAAAGIAGRMAELERGLSAMRSQSAAWQAASAATPDYMLSVMAGINALATEGLSYWAMTPESGIVVSNCPLDPVTGQPAQVVANPGAVRLRNGVIQTTATVTSGEWDWESGATAIRGGGIVANAITAGTISDASGANRWNLDTGVLTLGGYATTEDAEDAARTATGFLELDQSTGTITCGNKTSGSYTGTRAVMDSEAYRIVSEDGTDISSFGAHGETFYDDEGNVIGYVTYQQYQYTNENGDTVVVNSATYGGGDVSILRSKVASIVEMNNGKTGLQSKSASVACRYPTNNENENPIVEIRAAAGTAASSMIVRPEGLTYSGKAYGTTSYTNSDAIEVRKHAGVVTVNLRGIVPSSAVPAGSARLIFTLAAGYRPKTSTRAISTVVNDYGTSAILTVEGNGTVSMHARGTDLEAGAPVWGQITFFAES